MFNDAAGTSEKAIAAGSYKNNDARVPLKKAGPAAGVFDSYFGGKSGAGVYQSIINLIPPHDVYIETHLGGGGILRAKKRARKSICIDIDPAVIEKWKGVNFPGAIFINGDSRSVLQEYQFQGDEFIYVDPPYLMETRKSGPRYNFEYTENDHVQLLRFLKKLHVNVMVSGYWSEMYAAELADWEYHQFQAMTRRGPVTETVWMNYKKPSVLHDYQYLGDSYRERERIARQQKRWLSRILKMDAVEQAAMMNFLNKEIRHRN